MTRRFEESQLDRMERKLDLLLALWKLSNAKESELMHTLDDVLEVVTDESTQVDSLVALTNGIHNQLRDVLAGVALPPGVQDKIDHIFSAVDANRTRVVQAINENTDAAPTPPAAPAPEAPTE